MSIIKFKDFEPKIAKTAWIHESAVVIGQVELSDDVSIWPTAVLRADINTIRVGARTNIQDGAICHVTHDCEYFPGGRSLTIGEDVTIGHNATLHGCTVGNQCLIGIGTVVLDGAVIEDYTVVGAGSFVPIGKVLNGGFLYIGSPVSKFRELTEKEIAMLKSSAMEYVAWKNDYAKN